MLQFAIISQTNRISALQLKDVVNAIQKQLENDFAPIWAIDVKLSIYPNGATLPNGVWPAYIAEKIDLDVDGYHHFTGEKTLLADNRIPYAKVKFNENWSYTLSHEILEMAHNPYADNHELFDELYYLEEIADATNSVGYEIDTIKVSNFVTPDYYNFTNLGAKKYDFMGLLKRPRELYEGGYISWANKAGDYYQAIKAKGKILIRKLTGSTSPALYQDNPITYIAGAIALYLIYRMFKSKKSK